MTTIIKNAEHHATNSGDVQFTYVIESNAHQDIVKGLEAEGFTVTCLDQVAQRYRIEW